MGLNYYMVHKCPCCDSEKRVHLGKSSAGWHFMFAGDKSKGITDLNSWLLRMNILLDAGWKLEDECGEEVKQQHLLKEIENRKSEKRNHCEEYADLNNWLDKDGNSFSQDYFS